MPQSLIKINGVIGSDDDLPLDTLVLLDNQNSGGEVSYYWEILDQPAGAADSLSSQVIQNPTFTPKKEGTYLLRLTVNATLPSEDINTAIAAVRQLKTRERVPAAGETLEDNPIRGWAASTNEFLKDLDGLMADPGEYIGVNATGGTLARGKIVRATSSETIKTGLPGEEKLPGFVLAPATTAGALDELLLIVESGVDDSNPVSAGGLVIARALGRLAALPIGAGVVGDPLYVSDTAGLSTSPGSNIRQVASILSVDGANRDVWFAGTQGGNQAPVDRAFVVYGNPGPLSNALRVDGTSAGPVLNNIPFTIRGGDITTIPLVVRRYNASATADLLRIQDETWTNLARFDKDGKLLAPEVAAGDTSFALVHAAPGAGSQPLVRFATNDLLRYDRGTNTWTFEIASSPVVTITPIQTNVVALQVYDAEYLLTVAFGRALIVLAADDIISYDRATNTFEFFIGGVPKLSLDSGLFYGDVTGTFTNGLNVGIGETPGPATTVSIGDANFKLLLGAASGLIYFDNNDWLGYLRASNVFSFNIGGSAKATLDAASLAINSTVELWCNTYKWAGGTTRSMEVWVSPAGMGFKDGVDGQVEAIYSSISLAANFGMIPVIWPVHARLIGLSIFVTAYTGRKITVELIERSWNINTTPTVLVTLASSVGGTNEQIDSAVINISRADHKVYALQFSVDGNGASLLFGARMTFEFDEAPVENWSQ